MFFHPVSGKTLNAGQVSYWLAKAINWVLTGAMGVADDVRKLSTTMAWFMRVLLDQIVAAGLWRRFSRYVSSRSYVFQKVYTSYHVG